MPNKVFLYEKYAQDNTDLAESYGSEDELLLHSHYDKHGRAELRGIDLVERMRIEEAIFCDDGYVLLAGWVDRRFIPTINVSIEAGYERYDFGAVDPAWYHRPDVSLVTGDSRSPSGFFMVLSLDELRIHPEVTVYLSGKPVYHTFNARWNEASVFLNHALNCIAVLADRPVGETIEAFRQLEDPFSRVWKTIVRNISFTLAYEYQSRHPINRSIIITLHRRFDMLVPQLESLAVLLGDTKTEVVVICNDVYGIDILLSRLRGFSIIWPLSLRVYVCSGNSGFSIANNFGAKVSQGETLIFMNPDVFPGESAPLAASAKTFLTVDPGSSLVGAVLYYGEGALMHSGMYAVRDSTIDPRSNVASSILRIEHFGKGLSHKITHSDASLEAALTGIEPRYLLVSAALWKINKSVFLDCGGLPEDYIFAYYEDADFCLSLLNRGVPIELDTTARWIHLEGASRQFSPAQRAFMWLNRCRFSLRFADSPYVAMSADDLVLL